MVFVETTPSYPVTPLKSQHPSLSISRPGEAESRLAPLPSSWRFSFLEHAPRLTAIATSADVALKDKVTDLQDRIQKHIAGKVVFSRQELSEGDYYDKLPLLPLDRQVKAAEIALREVQKYPAGFFEKIGLKTLGIFEACISNTNDGYHEYDSRYGGYRWYGIYNFNQGAVGAYYSDAQLPLTIHHEIFHAVDAHLNGVKGMQYYESDNDPFYRATSGQALYPGLSLPVHILSDLKKVARGAVLRDAVSEYTKKSPDEDQAETARHFMMNIADSLIQAAERPELPGSQRILHVLEQYRTCIKDGPDASWFASVALGKLVSTKEPPEAHQPSSKHPNAAVELGSPDTILRSLFGTITSPNKAFIVRGSAPDAFQPNPTLQSDIRTFATTARNLATIEQQTNGRYAAEADLRELLGMLDAYEGFVTLNYKISRETRGIFQKSREHILDLLPPPSRRELLPRLFNPHYLGKVDRAIHAAHGAKPNVKQIVQNVRSVQPAVVLINRASGFNINADGTIVTNAHVAQELNKAMKVQFPNGTIFDGECTHIDHEIDLAVVRLKNVKEQLPFLRFSKEEAPVGTEIVLIGQPGTYDHWHVSTGKILNYHPHPHVAEDGYPLGGIEHNGWTFWGTSGSPILNLAGLVVGAHNTYDGKRNMRCGVRYHPTISFLKQSKVNFEFGP
jgi:S1-C subfamily serine protease